jgi:hypothetical protein
VDARPDGECSAGGIIGADWVNTLAIAATCGIDIGWLLKLDPLARELAVDVLKKAIDYQLQRDERLAQMIISELAKSMNQ